MITVDDSVVPFQCLKWVRASLALSAKAVMKVICSSPDPGDARASRSSPERSDHVGAASAPESAAWLRVACGSLRAWRLPWMKCLHPFCFRFSEGLLDFSHQWGIKREAIFIAELLPESLPA